MLRKDLTSMNVDAIRRIRKLRIRTARMITSGSAGEYKSAFRGRGLQFTDVRQYQPGDDVRLIDWNVTARTGHPHVKNFTEERELTVLLLMDISPSLDFGTVNCLKRQSAAEICALLALTAGKNNDKAGLILFTDRIEKVIPPGKGVIHATKIIREAMYCRPDGKGTSLSRALGYACGAFKRRAVIFIISDFQTKDFRKSLSAAGRRHDVIAIDIADPVEMRMPDIGVAAFYDAETGSRFLIDTSDARSREEYAGNCRNRLDERINLFRSLKVDHLQITPDAPYLQQLVSFFRMRERRIR